MSAKKELPDAVRPTTPDGLAEKAYHVRDRFDGTKAKIWQTNLTYDEAWKLKQKLAGERKSTTVRVERMDVYAAAVATAKGRLPQAIPQHLAIPKATPAVQPKQYSLEQANAAALAAAKASLPIGSTIGAHVTDDEVDDQIDEEIAAAKSPSPELGSDDDLADLMGNNDDLDALIDQAESAVDSDQPEGR